MAKILIVDDDTNMANLVHDFLKLNNYVVDVLHTGKEALERIKFFPYDLIILDWGLPDMSGLDILKEFRTLGGEAKIIMMTGRTKIDEKESGLDAGADDYVTKPVDLRELTARVRALLRRPTQVTGQEIKVKDLTLDPNALRVTKDGKELNLAPREFALLEFFMRHPNEVFSPDAILDRVWPTDSEASSTSLRTCIKKLRQKIDADDVPSFITNISGVGYRFEGEK